jgi:hypothetical protein
MFDVTDLFHFCFLVVVLKNWTLSKLKTIAVNKFMWALYHVSILELT